MNCDKYSEWISLYIDEMLDQPARAEFENHIKNCSSCNEEVQILREMISDIGALEMIDLPEGFHAALMGKLKPPAVSKRKWYGNLKIISAAAAVFVFSVILINPLKINQSKDSMPEQRENAMGSRMMGPPETFSLDQAAESSEDQIPEPSAHLASESEAGDTFSIQSIVANEDEEVWHIISQDYGADKEIIITIAESLEIKLESLDTAEAEELEAESMILKTTLSQSKKDQLSMALEEMDTTIYVPDPIQSSGKEMPDPVTLIIMINQIHQ